MSHKLLDWIGELDGLNLSSKVIPSLASSCSPFCHRYIPPFPPLLFPYSVELSPWISVWGLYEQQRQQKHHFPSQCYLSI